MVKRTPSKLEALGLNSVRNVVAQKKSSMISVTYTFLLFLVYFSHLSPLPTSLPLQLGQQPSRPRDVCLCLVVMGGGKRRRGPVPRWRGLLASFLTGAALASPITNNPTRDYPTGPFVQTCELGSYHDPTSPPWSGSCPGFKPCPPGSSCCHGRRTPCPAGTYGLGGASPCNSNCSPGKAKGPILSHPILSYFIINNPYPTLTHLGYYCPEGSTKPTERPCGGPNLYCPEGSPEPLAVPVGYYSTGGAPTTRWAIALAQPGTYAQHGILYDCPGGRYVGPRRRRAYVTPHRPD